MRKIEKVELNYLEIEKLQEDNWKDLHNEKKFRRFIKMRCFLCDDAINPKKLFSYYQMHGNACIPCDARIGGSATRRLNHKKK